ncbi:helix-turn-helix domain-containing protein [Paenibacillus terrae]|uniref:DNA-binding protein n=1 Tax=Paenibacillus terrae TaxID=159743 RepID=A0A0D7WUG5_9BACL|nr:helix-turn-helix transcriptional regulator [Paenibacillus terrae]KJD42654.1 DNA-binding protein [Paenibacillus terrae]
MNNATTIRTELENLMIQNGYNMAQLARSTQLNPGTVSAILSGNRTLSIDELDRITSVMELPKGHFYERYFEEYLVDFKPNWTRISSILHNSVELDSLDLFKKVVKRFKDKLNYSSSLFGIAEVLFKNGKFEGAALLYEAVAENERNQHSKRLAMCQYRIFLIKQGENQQQNYQAANQFEPYVERLNEMDQLDALKDLANTYRSLRRWYKVEEVVHKLEHKARIQYQIKRQERNEQETLASPNRPLFFYLAYSNLLMAGVFEARGDYKKALQCTYAYADLSWVKETDEQTLYWMNLFKEWAEANTYGNKLLSGDIEILPDYLAYIQNNEDEILPALVNIMDAANRFGLNVDQILQRFESEIHSFIIQQIAVGTYTDNLVLEYIIYLFYELADYYLNQEKYSKAYDFLINCLEKSASTNNKSYIIMCVGLFESSRDMASSEIIAIYQEIIKGVHKNEKKDRSIMFGG